MREFQQFREAAGAELPACFPVFDAICGSDRWVALLASIAIYVLSTRTSIALLALRRRQRAEEAEAKMAATNAKMSATDPAGKVSGNVVAEAGAAAGVDQQQIARVELLRADRKPRRPRSKSPAPRKLTSTRAKVITVKTKAKG